MARPTKLRPELPFFTELLDRKEKKQNKNKEYFLYKSNTHTEIQELMSGDEKEKKNSRKLKGGAEERSVVQLEMEGY